MSEYKTNETNEIYVCYCGSKIKNKLPIIRVHRKSKKHLNYNSDDVLDTTTYYERNKEKILTKIKSEDYKKKQKVYQKNYYQKNREIRLSKIKESDSYRKNNVFVKCSNCFSIYKKYNLSFHLRNGGCIKSINNIKNKTHTYCICGDVIDFKYFTRYYSHLKTKRHRTILKYLFNINK